MATCRVLYNKGPKIALKKPIVISTTRQLSLFLKFLRTDNSFHCQYLRQLELQSFFMETDVIQELVETLPLLTSIEYLRLVEAEELLELHTALTPAFCTLTTLQHIDFSAAKNKTCTLLLGLHAPLISADIDFLANGDQRLWDHLDSNNWNQYHPTMLLKNFALTLEELQCFAWYTNQDALIPAQVYPNMHKLSIELHHFPIQIDAFIRAFPNLTEFRIMTEYHGGSMEVPDLAAMHETHATNVATQQRATNSCRTWAHLEHFQGCLVDLYTIGLISRICCVTIVDALGDSPQMDMLMRMLHYTWLLHLKVDAIMSTFLGDANRGFISMLRDASVSNLINLDVCVYFDEEDRDKDLSVVIDTLISVLSRLPLKFLELGFMTSYLNLTPPKPSALDCLVQHQQGLPALPTPLPAPFSPAELSLQSLDMDALITHLESMPSLQAVHVLVHSSRCEGDWKSHKRMIAKGTLHVAGCEQWEGWIPGKNGFVLVRLCSVRWLCIVC
ncbi:hypothetical protein V8D89_003655 [Ganoderma adspersum]